MSNENSSEPFCRRYPYGAAPEFTFTETSLGTRAVAILKEDLDQVSGTLSNSEKVDSRQRGAIRGQTRDANLHSRFDRAC